MKRRPANPFIAPVPEPRRRAFTLIEIAICLAIISFALVAIIGVLPWALNTQRDNREATLVSQDATVLLEAIRHGAQGVDYLTNHVYAITVYSTLYTPDGSASSPHVNSYTYTNASVPSPVYPLGPYSSAPLTNGGIIIGLLSTPEFIADVPGYPAVPDRFYFSSENCYSNRVVAYVRSISGLAAEQPPQKDPTLRESTLTYLVQCLNAAIPVDTNIYNLPPADKAYALALAGNQRELRLALRWPLMPGGNIPRRDASPLVNRALIAGQLAATNFNNYSNQWLYFYQPQLLTNAP